MEDFDYYLKFNENIPDSKFIDNFIQNKKTEFNKNSLFDLLISKYKTNIKLYEEIILFIRIFIKTFINGHGFKRAEIFIKKNNKDFFNINSQMNNFDYIFFRLKNKFDKLMLGRFYNKISLKEKNLDGNFIYFPAPFQPEADNTPNAGIYSNLIYTLKIISKYLPENISIVYKEHPATFMFKNNLYGTLIKNRKFYKELLKIKNLKLVSSDINSQNLIKKSICTITVCGSASLEALIIGKPSILFGNTYFKSCSEIFHIKKNNDLKIFFSKILTGYKPNIHKVKYFLMNLYKYSFYIEDHINNKYYDEYSKLIQKNNLKTSELIYRSINEYYT